jgi:putative ABC transport system permease protein
VAVAVAAGTVVASFDRVYHQPVRYGAWWDVAVGQYSDPEQLQTGIQLIKHNPNVSNAAAILENTDSAMVDDLTVNYLAQVPIVGVAPTVVASGRAPGAADEVALGAGTARKLHKGIGDTVTLASPDPQVDAHRTLRVTGIAVLNNPVSGATNAGDGIVVSPETANLLNGREQTAQSVVIKLAPTVDRKAAIESIVRDFPASARLATPQVDLANLDRLRSVPWFLAAIIAVLALGSLVHALVTLLQRHTGDLAVLAALGMTRRQRRNVGVVAGLVLAGVSIAIGIPAGSGLGRSVWGVVAHRVFVPSGAVMPWGPTVAAPTVALLVSVGIAAFAARWFTRRTPAAQLRAE